MSLKSFCLNLLFPLECLGCRQEGTWLCSKCFQQLKFNDGKKKYNLKIANLNQVFIAGDYDDPLLAKLIKKFKYNFNLELGPILARFLIKFWRKLDFDFPSNPPSYFKNLDSVVNKNKKSISLPPWLIPIPLSKKRQRWRGFNQAEVLAREFSSNLNYPLNLGLKKLKEQKPQASLNENERGENIKHAFTWTGASLAGRIIILIDDVITTGATLNEAAKILRQAGANKVYGLVVAKG